MLYIIPNAYEPGTAATNRALALLKGLDSIVGESEVNVVFFEPNLQEDKIADKYRNVRIQYLWHVGERQGSNILLRVKTIFRQRLFCKRLKKGDKVLLLGYPHLLKLFLNKKGIKVYHEMNEYPGVIPLGPKGQQISVETYLQQCKKLDGLFVISNTLKTYFAEAGVPEERIHLYRMTVDASRFADVAKEQVDVPYIAYCGTATNYKDGVDILLKAFSILKQSFIEPLQLHIYGKVPSQEEKHANEKLMTNLDIAKDVEYKGVVTAAEMPQLLTNASALVLARPDNIQAKYGFPTKLGEYLLSGNPVIVTTVGDIPLYLWDGENALLSEPNNPQAVADKILWALEHPEEAATIGLQGKKTAMKYFNANTESEHIMNIITSDCNK